MFDSQNRLSSKGPLGAIWVAAYFMKNLKKAQIKETDISSCVDKILREEPDVFTHRILAYLLLGIVRIYSRKAEYLVHDCNEVLGEVKKFLVNAKGGGDIIETLRRTSSSITLPRRFELDAFDLEIPEDIDVRHVVCNEAITLEDVPSKNEALGRNAMDELWGFLDAGEDRSKSMFSPYNYELDACQDEWSSDRDDMVSDIPPLQMVESAETENNAADTDNNSSEDCQTSQNIVQSLETAIFEDASNSEAYLENLQSSRCSNEESIDIHIFSRNSEEPIGHEEQSVEDLEINRQQVTRQESAGLENEMHQAIGGICEDRFSDIEEVVDQNDAGGSGEVNRAPHKEKIRNVIVNEDGELQANIPEPTMASGGISQLEATNTSGATSSEALVLPTPALLETGRLSRKRKCTVDRNVVSYNEVLKRRIDDARASVSKQKRGRRPRRAARKACRVSRLGRAMQSESVVNNSLILLSDTVTDNGTQNLDSPESQGVVRSEKRTRALHTDRNEESSDDEEEGPMRTRSIKEIYEVTEPIDTPSLNSPVGQHESPETEGSLISYDSIEDNLASLTILEEPDLMMEEFNSFETDSESNGWSERTRTVVDFFDKKFLEKKSQKEMEVVNVLQVLESPTRKECAKLFYETLVLGTTGYVDVKQTSAYGDITIRKLPKWDEELGAVKRIDFS